MTIINRTLCPLLAAALLGGCFGTSPSARFYSLTPQETRGIVVAEKVEVVVSVGPVSLPTYLDRRQIVTRSGSNEILLAEYDRWGGALDDEITRLLVSGLTERLSSKGFAFMPWRSVPLADVPLAYRIPVGIDRFDGVPGETVVLKASWAVVMKRDKQEQGLIARESMISEATGGKDYAALVAAMGKAVERLGKEIGENLTALNEQKK